jgi:hypothetical protein
MLLDNADDDSIFFNGDDSGRAPLVNFLPQVAHGFILITLWNRLAAWNLVGCHGHVIDIPPINKKESLALLRVRNPASQSAVEDARALVQALEYIPLAIT